MTNAKQLFGLLALAGLVTVGASAQATHETWLGGVPPVGQQVRHISDPTYLQMFEPGAPWKVSGAGLTVFKTSTQEVQNGTDAELRSMFAALRERQIKFAVEMGLLSGTPGGCGKATEGFNAIGVPRKVLERVKALGGVVDYVAMDEPVIYGHRPVPTRNGGCQYPLPDMADMVAAQVKSLREVFPDLLVGDIEPVGGGPDGAPVNRDIVQFAALLRQRTNGVAPAFFHADMQWATPGTMQTFEQLAQMLHARHIPVGVICNGGGKGITNGKQWVANAIQRCGTVHQDGRIAADTYIVQTWEALPNKMLPENDPGSLTFGLLGVERMVGAGR